MQNPKEEILRLKTRYRRENNLDLIKATVGDASGNVQADIPGWVWVRIQSSNGLFDKRRVLPPAGKAMSLKPGAAVTLEYDKMGNLRIAEPDTLADLSGGVNVLAQVVQPTQATIPQTALETLRVIPTNPPSLIVAVKSWAPIVNGVEYFFAGAPVDLTLFVPAAGNMRYATIFVKNDYATPEVKASTARSVADVPLDSADIQECINAATAGDTPVWAIKLVGNQSTITQDDINGGPPGSSVDLRQMVNTTAGSTVSPLTTKGDVWTYSTVDTRFPVGIDYSSLIADSIQTTGLRWKLPYLFGMYNYASPNKIGSGWSDDGRRFSRKLEPAIDVGAGGSWESNVVKDPYVVNVDGVLWCYYSGYNGSVFKIGVARSYDGGATWTKYGSNPVLSPTQGWENNGTNEVNTPIVLYDYSETDSTKRWKMWYAGGQFGAGGIGYAYSSDGLSWTKYASNPVLAPVAATWESTYFTPGAIVKLGSTYYLWYNGNAGAGTWKAGLATFTSATGTYTKNANNPLLAGDGKTTTVSSNVAVNDTTLTLADATIFPIGAAVWVYDNSGRYLSYVTAQPSSTTLTLADAAPITIASASGHVRSAAYNSVTIENAIYDGGWTLIFTAFQPGLPDGGVRETAMLAYADAALTTVRIDYQPGLLLRPTLTETQASNTSTENLTLADARTTARRLLAPQSGGSTSPLTTKGDVWGYSTVDARVPIGTDAQALIADSSQALGLKWGVLAMAGGGTGQSTDTKGDLLAGTGSAWAKLGVGTDGQVLSADSTQSAGLKWVAQSSGGGGSNITKTTKSYYQRTVLYDNTLSGAGSWDVSSLDQTYDHLEIYLYARATVNSAGGVSAKITFNNDTTAANYNEVQLIGNSSGAGGSFNTSNQDVFFVTDAGDTANRFASAKALIQNYANTTDHKVINNLEVAPISDANSHNINRSVTWKSTAAINRIAIAVDNATTTFVSGSRLIIVGVKAETVVTDVSGSGVVQFTASADTTVASTASETSLLSTINGTQTFAANALSAVGRTLRIQAWGYLSDTGTPTIELRFKLGSTTLLDSGAITLGSGISNKLWRFEGLLTVQTAGASGKMKGQGVFVQNGTVSDIINTGQSSLDFTSSLLADLTATWSASSSSNTITASNVLVEVLN